MSNRPEQRADALAGSLLGLALGDALGFVVEAQPPGTAREYVNRWLRAGHAGKRGHPSFPFGQYSDDTQLARELLLSVRDAGRWEPAAFAARTAKLIFSGRDIGAGPGTRSAGLRLLLGAPWDHAGTPAPYAGNGTAMRAAPIGLLFDGDTDRWLRCAREQSRVTHADSRCAAAAVAIAGAAALASSLGPIVPRDFLAQLAVWAEPEDRSMAEAIRGLPGWAHLEPDAAGRRLDAGGHGITPFVVPSVLWSLYAFLRSPDDYWEAVCTAIAVGGDTDTMAAMTGGIAGARLGTSALPAGLVARLNDRGSWDSAALSRLAHECAGIP
jgi:ADP-ribosylglycohydrolase